MMGSAPPCLVLFGPTASGKSALASSLFSTTCELISADSMQVYRGMDIGTAKPSLAERSRFPHHLIDILDIGEQFTAGDFVRLAEDAIRGIHARGKLPLVSGGTAFYIKSLVQGMPPAPPSDPAVRKAVARDLEERGAAALMEELTAADPEAAARIHPNDAYRLTRALEVFRTSGKPLSSFKPAGSPREDASFLLIGIRRDREDLTRRIQERVDAMFAAGLPDEVSGLEAAGWGPSDPGMRGIGYAEFLQAAAAAGKRVADLDEDALRAVRQAIVKNSAAYAKRQMTFFRSLSGVEWFDADDGRGIERRVEEWMGRNGGGR